ncbi:MAG: flavodoxin family protein [Firmicutes bacterium]|nr:flavodoxin family protein [Bacillota bacterium]
MAVNAVAYHCLALVCSPRKDGNTEILARRALEGAASAGAATEMIFLRDCRYAPCSACDGCFRTGKCVVKDDAAEIFARLLAADGVILAAPIFSMGICAQAKMIIDRSQQFWALKYVLHRPVIEDEEKRRRRRGIFLSASGTGLPGVFDGARRVAGYFFKMLDISGAGSYCYSGVDRKGDILAREEALLEVFEAGFKLVTSSG